MDKDKEKAIEEVIFKLEAAFKAWPFFAKEYYKFAHGYLASWVANLLLVESELKQKIEAQDKEIKELKERIDKISKIVDH